MKHRELVKEILGRGTYRRVNFKALWDFIQRVKYKHTQEVMGNLYIAHMTLRECAEELGVTPERVRQVEAKTLRMLRHPACRRVYQLGKVYPEPRLGDDDYISRYFTLS